MITKISTIYGFPIFVCSKDTTTKELSQIDSYYKDYNNNDFINEYRHKAGFVHYIKDDVIVNDKEIIGYIVYIFEYNIGTIAHEAMHVFDSITLHCDLGRNTDSSEYRAYFLEWIETQICSALHLTLK